MWAVAMEGLREGRTLQAEERQDLDVSGETPQKVGKTRSVT